jgi:hypothetical protein
MAWAHGTEKARSSVVPTFALRLSIATLFDPSFVPADYLNECAVPAYEVSQRDCLQAIEQRVVAFFWGGVYPLFR